MKGRGNKVDSRIEWVFIIFIIFNCVVVIQLVNLQIIKYSFYSRKAKKMHLSTIKQQMGRGTIYDRNGNKLAVSIKSESICAEPSKVRAKNKTARFLSGKLGLNYYSVLKKLKSNSQFEYILRKADPEIADSILEKGYSGIYTRTEEKRFYPASKAAAHILGFSGMDNYGLEGLELKYERYLRGKIGRVQIRRDAKRRMVRINTVDIRKGERGGDLHLAIDSSLQNKAFEEIKRTAEKYNAKNASAVILDPQTGAVLAMANYPSYDPNDFGDYTVDIRRNRAVTDIFEPGSTFKIFTMSVFLKEFDEGEKYKVHCGNGKRMFFNRYVHDHEKHGWLTAPEVIKYSSNIGMVSLAMKIKQKDLYKEYRRFGFGKETGIDFPGEASGILRHYSDWDNTSLTSLPYGQEVAVTAIQLARAYAAIANGGYLVTPYLVEKVEKDGRVVFKNKGKKGKKILDSSTRRKLVDMLEGAVGEGGTGKKAFIPGYRVAGKTGTGQKHKKNGKGYMKGKYAASFAGFLPVGDPEVVSVIVVDEPGPWIYYGGDVAAPAFRNISETVISRYRILPPEKKVVQEITEEAEREIVKLPDFYLMKFLKVKKFLKENNIRYKQFGYGHYVINQKPAPGETADKDKEVLVFLGDRLKDERLRIYMPDLKGESIRRSLEVMRAFGFEVKCSGSGYAAEQSPKPGVALPDGKVVEVKFKMDG